MPVGMDRMSHRRFGIRIGYMNAQDCGGDGYFRRRRIEVEEKPSESSPLTLRELRDMLVRHVDNAQITMVIEDAMKRRLSDVPKGVA